MYKYKYQKYKRKYLELKNKNLIGGGKSESVKILDDFEKDQWNYWKSVPLKKRIYYIRRLNKINLKGLIKIQIKNKKIITSNYSDNHEFLISRMDSILFAIKKIVNELPDCILFLYTKAGYAYRLEKRLKFPIPIFCFARPRNKVDKIVIPDYTFFKEKIEEKEIDWDEQKKLILSKCTKLKNKQKDLLYFRGADTTVVTNLRSNIGKFLNNSKIIIFENDKKRVPTYNFCKYKYLLDLPGKQPWSVRLKYLLLMPSTCIKVTQITKYTDENLIEEEWISFINKYIEPNKDYIDVPFECVDSKIDFKKLGNLIMKSKKRDNSLRENQVSKITMETIYESLKNTIIEYAKLFPIKEIKKYN